MKVYNLEECHDMSEEDIDQSMKLATVFATMLEKRNPEMKGQPLSISGMANTENRVVFVRAICEPNDELQAFNVTLLKVAFPETDDEIEELAEELDDEAAELDASIVSGDDYTRDMLSDEEFWKEQLKDRLN